MPELKEDADERWLQTIPKGRLQIHGFSDASSRAYAAAIYFRTQDESGKSTRLTICKTKVAPIKTISIPKLELSAAFLLANLMDQLKRNLDLSDLEFFAWSDAKVALTWIKSPASRWKPFVANRASQIQSLTDVSIWNYVPGDCNPADLATRDLSPQQLRESTLWKNGPDWLAEDSSFWPINPELQKDERASQELRAKAQVGTEWKIRLKIRLNGKSLPDI